MSAIIESELRESDICEQLLLHYGRPRWTSCPIDTSALDFSSNPRSAWNALTQENQALREFCSDDRRRFAQSSPTKRIRANERPPEFSFPTSNDEISTYLCDMSGMMLAEDYAKMLATRLMPWSAVCSNEVVWYCTNDPLDYKGFLGLAYDSARDTVELAIEEWGEDYEKLIPSPQELPLPFLVQHCVGAWRCWHLAEKLSLSISDPQWPLAVPQSTLFSQLPNPFEPLLKIWLTGYILLSSFDDEDQAIRLYSHYR